MINNFYLNNLNSLAYNEYLPILIFLLIAIILSCLLITLSYLLAVQNPETEKLSTYECGFEPYGDARNIFDVKFFISFPVPSLLCFDPKVKVVNAQLEQGLQSLPQK